MNDRPFLSHFSPQWTDPRYLEAILVQREGLLKESVALMRESVLTPNKHHLLFVGSRGSGKTHLVTLIHHRLRQDPGLAERMRFAWLNEDETATSFLLLLVQIYRSLGERYPAEFPAATLTGLAGQDQSTARENLGQALLRDLRGRTLVCLMENLDSLFRHLTEADQRTWRAFVQNHPVFATVGTAQALFDGISDREEPFFGFFDTRHLDPLTVEEARTLLEKIASLKGKTDLLEFLRTPAGHARVAAIRALAGGNPRLYLVFSDLLVNVRALDDLVRPFEEMVDRQLTTYYQERLRWLSPQQREIIQLLCRSKFPVAVKHIAEGLFTSHSSITGQLKQLREMRYVDGNQVGREVLYELAEPLMRLALQVKETHDRKPLALIVDFLRVWHERREIEAFLADCDPASPGHSYFAAARTLIDSGPNLRHEILRRDLDHLEPEQYDENALAHARCLAEESELPADWLTLGRILDTREEWLEAIAAFGRVVEMDNATPAEVAEALIYRGVTHGQAGRADEEIADYTRAIELPGAPAGQVARARCFRGVRGAEKGQAEPALRDMHGLLDLTEDAGVADFVKARLPSLAKQVIGSVFSCTTDPARWTEQLASFARHFARFDGVLLLGDALVKHLPELAKSPLNHAAWDAWADAWEAARTTLPPAGQDRLEIPLRLLRTGIAYLKTKQESRLLALPSEERRVLRETLGLPPEKTL